VTLVGYRSAISSVWEQVSGPTLAGERALVRLLASFHKEHPRSLARVPTWDLNLVLRYLRWPRIHPSRIEANPLAFAQKTAFFGLISLGRRCSDVLLLLPTVWRTLAGPLSWFRSRDISLRFGPRPRGSIAFSPWSFGSFGLSSMTLTSSCSARRPLCWPAILGRRSGILPLEIHALASSLAVQSTFALTDVLGAAQWATPLVFASFYL